MIFEHKAHTVKPILSTKCRSLCHVVNCQSMLEKIKRMGGVNLRAQNGPGT